MKTSVAPGPCTASAGSASSHAFVQRVSPTFPASGGTGETVADSTDGAADAE